MIFVSTTSIINNKDLFNVLDRYNKLGIKNIELGSVHNYIKDFKPLFKFQKDNDIKFTIHGFFPPVKEIFFINITSQNEKTLKKSIGFCKNSIDMCRKLNADIYTTHSGFTHEIANKPINGKVAPITKEKYSKKTLFNTLSNSLTEICDYANNYNIKIAIETMYASDATLMNNAKTFLKFFKNHKLKNLGILFDTGHMKSNSFIQNFNFKESVEKLKKHIIALHLQDNTGKGADEHLPIKNTEILDCFGKDFLKNKYITLEGQNKWTEQDILESKKIVEHYLE